MAAAYLMVRGVEPTAAVNRAGDAFGRTCGMFLTDALLDPGFTVE